MKTRLPASLALLCLLVLQGCATLPLPVDAGLADAGLQPRVLRVRYPAAAGRAFTVVGSAAPFSWDAGVAMTKVDDTTWELPVPASVGALEWRPVLDDTTAAKGPGYQAAASGATEVYPRFLREAGTWSRRWTGFRSEVLNNTRGVWVYLPPTALENTLARFPVVYMHDGQNLFDPRAAFGGNTWRVAETLDRGAQDGTIAEAIVVGPENTADRIAEYTPTPDPQYGGGKGDLYLRMLVEELKPRVDEDLPSLPGREHTVLMGSSLGGLISVVAGVRRAAVFGHIGALSPSTWWDGRVLLTLVPQVAEPRPLKVYVDSGDSGTSRDDLDNTRALAEAWRALGYVDGQTLKYTVGAGDSHNEAAWSRRLPGALQFLLGPGR